MSPCLYKRKENKSHKSGLKALGAYGLCIMDCVMSRQALIADVQRWCDEIVCWIDCGFYLMPVTSSKLSRFGLSWQEVKVVEPLESLCTANDPIFESANVPEVDGVQVVDVVDVVDRVQMVEEKQTNHIIENNKYNIFPYDFSFSHSMFPRIFFS